MGDEVIQTTEDPTVSDLQSMKIRWQNRRRMAWVSLISMIIVTALIFFTDLVELERVKVLTEVITWFYFCCTGVIGMYMGATTFASIKGVKG